MELSLALERPCYFPGEVVKVLVKVRRLPDAPPPPGGDALSLSFECAGSERVDPSWVGALYRPEVTATKDSRVPLLEGGSDPGLGPGGREFVVRLRLPARLPPSYRGTAVRYVYAASLTARLTPTGAAPGGAGASCAAQSSFVVWPVADRGGGGGGLDRRASLQAAAGSAAAAPPGGAAPGGEAAGPGEPECIEYGLGARAMRLRVEEVVRHGDGSRSIVCHAQPPGALYPALSARGSLASSLLAGQTASLDCLQLDEQQLAAEAAGGGAGDDGDDGGGGPLRHLTPAQRASMAVVALLESEEVVPPPHAHGRASGAAAARKLHAEQAEVTAHLLTCHFLFSIPLTAPPSFRTPMVAHRWVLRFELTLGKPRPGHHQGQLATEQLLWSLPLVVFPPLPGGSGAASRARAQGLCTTLMLGRAATGTRGAALALALAAGLAVLGSGQPVDDSFTRAWGSRSTLDVLATGGAAGLRITKVSAPTLPGARATLATCGPADEARPCIRYVAPPYAPGTEAARDWLTYRTAAPDGTAGAANVSVQLVRAPDAVDDRRDVPRMNATYVFADLLSNDVDHLGLPLTIAALGPAGPPGVTAAITRLNGTAVSVTLRGAPTSFTYRVRDRRVTGGAATVVVGSSAPPPELPRFDGSVTAGQAHVLDVLGDARTKPAGGLLRLLRVSQPPPGQGSVSLVPCDESDERDYPSCVRFAAPTEPGVVRFNYTAITRDWGAGQGAAEVVVAGTPTAVDDTCAARRGAAGGARGWAPAGRPRATRRRRRRRPPPPPPGGASFRMTGRVPLWLDVLANDKRDLSGLQLDIEQPIGAPSPGSFKTEYALQDGTPGVLLTPPASGPSTVTVRFNYTATNWATGPGASSSAGVAVEFAADWRDAAAAATTSIDVNWATQHQAGGLAAWLGARGGQVARLEVARLDRMFLDALLASPSLALPCEALPGAARGVQAAAAVVESLGALTRLRRLELELELDRNAVREQTALAAAVGALTQLTRLYLRVERLPVEVLAPVSALTALAELRLVGTDLSQLPQLPTGLTRLELNGLQLAPAALAACTGLRHLECGVAARSGALLAAVGACTQLEHVAIGLWSRYGPRPAAWARLAALSGRLTSLSFGSGFEYAGFYDLYLLRGTGAHLFPAGRVFSRLQRLQLAFGSRFHDDDELETAQADVDCLATACPALRELTLAYSSDWGARGEYETLSLQGLLALTCLTRLQLTGGHNSLICIWYEVETVLARLTGLRELAVQDCCEGLTTAGALHLTALTALTSLFISEIRGADSMVVDLKSKAPAGAPPDALAAAALGGSTALVTALAAAALLAGWAAAREVTSESVVVLAGVGVLLASRRRWGGRAARFLDMADLHSAFTLTTTNVHVHLAFLLHTGEEIALAFPSLSPGLSVLAPLYRQLLPLTPALCERSSSRRRAARRRAGAMVYVPLLKIDLPEPRIAELLPGAVHAVLGACTRVFDAVHDYLRPLSPEQELELYEAAIAHLPREFRQARKRIVERSIADEDKMSEELEDAAYAYYRRRMREHIAGYSDEETEDVTFRRLMSPYSAARDLHGLPQPGAGGDDALAGPPARGGGAGALPALPGRARRVTVTTVAGGVGLALGAGVLKLAHLLSSRLRQKKPKRRGCAPGARRGGSAARGRSTPKTTPRTTPRQR
ncbi:hypothetical protein HT031_005582 [Scenedesmus sp. PABB004]|nr:hypothetical protein HT031_005582 [Scenedesmus sp. PABB004]